MTSSENTPFVFAPDWPGLKLGVELALSAAESNGDPIIWRWRGALWLEAAALQRFAAAVISLSDEALDKMPKTEADIPNFFPGEPADANRPASTLGDAQALCAALWAFTPIYAQYDEELSDSEANKSAPPLHILQLPRSPGEMDSGSGDFIRAAFCSARRVTPSYLESRDPLALAAKSSLAALERQGALELGAWIEETQAAPPDWDPAWARGGWDLNALGQFQDLWRKTELALASSRACPTPRSAGAGRI